jgi:hypothetical protein
MRASLLQAPGRESSLKPLDTTLEFIKVFGKIGLSNKDIDTLFREMLPNENFKLEDVF